MSETEEGQTRHDWCEEDEFCERDRQVFLAQLHNLMLALRTNTKFTSKMRFVQASKDPEHPLTHNVMQLREALFSPLTSFRALTEEKLLHPFVEVVLSEETSGPITGVALAAFVAFLDFKCSFLTTASLIRIINCAKNTKSEVTDSQSHEAVLARILQVYVGCAKHPAGANLSDQHIVTMLESIFAFTTLSDPSELLRRTAEQSMNDIVAATYERCVRYQECAAKTELLRYLCRVVTCETVDVPPGRVADENVLRASVQLQGLCLAHTVLFILKDEVQTERFKSLLTCIRNDLSRALLIVGRHTQNVVVLSQMLRTLHLVVSFASIHVVPQTLSFISTIHLSPLMCERSETCVPCSPGMIATPTNSAATPTRSFNRITEDFERREREESLMESLVEFCGDASFPTFVFYHYDLCLEYPLVLESLCTFLSRNCFHPSEQVTGQPPQINQINVLSLDCLLAMLSSMTKRVRAMFAQLDPGQPFPCHPSIPTWCARKQRLLKFAELFSTEPKKAIDFLRTQEDCDNSDADALGISPQCSGWDIGAFLYKYKSLLDKTKLGEYMIELGKEPLKPLQQEDPDGEKMRLWEEARQDDFKKAGTVRFCEQKMKGFLNCFVFRGKPLLRSIRDLVFHMRLTGEAQQIDRFMEEFAIQWFSSNRNATKEINPFLAEDAAFILSFSIIMLNTDLHCGKLQKNMTREEFIKINRGIDKEGSNLPEEYLGEIYDDVKKSQIVMVDMIGSGFDDDSVWELEVDESRKIEILHGSEIRMRGSDLKTLTQFDTALFQVLWRPCISAFATIVDACGSAFRVDPHCTRWEEVEKSLTTHLPKEFSIFDSAMKGFHMIAEVGSRLKVCTAIDRVVVSLLRLLPFNLHNGYKNLVAFGKNAKAILALRTLTEIVFLYGIDMLNAWTDFCALLHKMYLLGMFAETGEFEPKVSKVLLQNPGIAAPNDPTPHSKDGGWFAGFWGSPEAAAARKQAILEEENISVMRVKNACPTICRVMKMCDDLTDGSFTCFVNGLITSGELPENASPSQGFISSFCVHFTAEVLARNITRFELVENDIVSHFFSVFHGAVNFYVHSLDEEQARVSKNETEDSAKTSMKEYWKSICIRVIAAMLGLVTFFLNSEQHAAFCCNAMSEMARIPAPAFSLVCDPLARVMSYFLKARPELCSPTSVTLCEDLIFVGECVAILSPSRESRNKAQELLISIVLLKAPLNTAHVSRLAAALTQVVTNQPNEDTNPEPSTELPLPPTLHDEMSMTFGPNRIENIVAALVELHNRLASQLTTKLSDEDSNAWFASWETVLQGLGAIVLFQTNAKLASDALLALQRCILSAQLLNLSPDRIGYLFSNMIFPLIEKLCVPTHESTQSTTKNAVSQTLSFLSPSVLLSSVFGPMAGPNDKQASSVKAQTNRPMITVTDEIQSRAVSMLPKAFLHYLVLISRDTQLFEPLWQRLLGTLFGLHLQNRQSTQSSMLLEAIEENVKNIVLVIATTDSSQPEILQPYPEFWSTTRQLLKPFPFSTSLLPFLPQ